MNITYTTTAIPLSYPIGSSTTIEHLDETKLSSPNGITMTNFLYSSIVNGIKLQYNYLIRLPPIIAIGFPNIVFFPQS